MVVIELTIFERIARSFPALELKIRQAGMKITSVNFVKKAVFTAFYLTTFVVFLLGALFLKLNILLRILYFIFPLLFVGLFFYFMKLPDFKIYQKEKEIEKEIVFAGRFLVIELQSGVPLYNALINVSDSYQEIGKAIKEIVENVDLGATMEEALEETIEITPSQNFRKLLWQIMNSLKTGADISSSLNSVVEQITREQIIAVKDYGRKLNPFAMFYMMIAVIVPSLGVTMLIVLSSFLSFELSVSVLLIIAAAIGLVQFMFIGLIKSSRPAVEI
ncbi:type II secretion system F family protein [Candidatus Woesearchaeota archaeon]|nr:type II secretion system F family protein [Candidatus Woesearchaeota archaeon]